MAQRITDQFVRRIEPPEKGNRIAYDTEIKGFGVRVTAAGSKSFVLNYRVRGDGRERRFTIGRYGPAAWTVAAARRKARVIRGAVDNGADPLGTLKDGRAAPTVAALCDRFVADHLPGLRESTRCEYRALIETRIKPEIGRLKVDAVKFSDIERLHRRLTQAGSPYRANRVVAVVSKMFNLALKWEWRTDGNPARGIDRNHERPRNRYLSGEEIARLTDALAAHDDQQAANIIRLLMLTGARRGEVQSMCWADIDLEAGIWTKSAATTKQKTEHRVPLSAPARQLLDELQAAADKGAEYVFPGPGRTGHRTEIKHDWAALCEAANIRGARLHDLRHTYASVLASAGLSLPVIGALLGHTQAQTTQRYAHLFDDPLRAATDRAGAIVTGAASAEVVSPPRWRREG